MANPSMFAGLAWLYTGISLFAVLVFGGDFTEFNVAEVVLPTVGGLIIGGIIGAIFSFFFRGSLDASLVATVGLLGGFIGFVRDVLTVAFPGAPAFVTIMFALPPALFIGLYAIGMVRGN